MTHLNISKRRFSANAEKSKSPHRCVVFRKAIKAFRPDLAPVNGAILFHKVITEAEQYIA